MEKMQKNKDKSSYNLNMKGKILGEILKVSPKDCLIQSADFLKNTIFEGNKFFIFGSSMEVLLGNSDLEMHDIDIHVIIKGEDDKQKIIHKFENNGFRCLEQDNPNKRVFLMENMCFDIHFLNEIDGYYIEHSNQGDFEYPVEGYGYTQDGIGYMKPTLCLQIAEGGRWNETKTFKGKIKYKFGKKGRKNERRIERLKKLLDEKDDISKIKFTPTK